MEKRLKEIKEDGGLAVVEVTAQHANVPIHLTGEHSLCFISSRRSSSSQLDSHLEALHLKSRALNWIAIVKLHISGFAYA